MCLGAPATGTYNCVPLTEDDASNLPGYINPELNSNLKRMIAVLSGKGLSRVPEWYCPVWDGNAGACTMPESGKIFNKRIGVERGSCEGSNCWACAAAEQTPVAGLITRPRYESNEWHAWGHGVTLSFNAEGTSATLSNPDFGDCEPTWTEFFIQVVASNVPVDLCSATTYFEGIAENLACDLWLNSGHSCDTKWEDVCATDNPSGADYNSFTVSASCTQCPVDLCSATTYFEGIAENLACHFWLDAGHSCNTKWEDVCATDHPSGADHNSDTVSTVGCSQCPSPPPPPPSPPPSPPPPSPPPPSPPPTPPPSPSPGAIAHQVTTRFMLDGTITDFDAAAQVSIKTVLAREADVSTSAVTLTLTAGSVIVQADIVLATAEGANFAASQLSAGVLASSETLETALNTQFKADGVDATASVQAIVDAPEVVSTGDDSQGVRTSLLVGIVVSGVAVLLGLLFGVCVLWRKQRKNIGGALKQSAGAIGAPVSEGAPVVELAAVQAALVVQQASVPGSSTQHTNKHTLATDVEILKRQLGLNGTVSEVVKEAATQLAIDSNGRPLSDVSMECVRSLGTAA